MGHTPHRCGHFHACLHLLHAIKIENQTTQLKITNFSGNVIWFWGIFPGFHFSWHFQF